MCHYPPSMYGLAFGPLGLDQTIRFCSILETLAKKGHVTVVTKMDDVQARSNTAVLLGAFLLLYRDIGLDEVRRLLPSDAAASFTCSWRTTSNSPMPERALTVLDCWSGLQIAKENKWVDLESFADDVTKADVVCSVYHTNVVQYDITWLVPRRIMVSSDPMTTIKDPDPHTCQCLDSRRERVATCESLVVHGRKGGSQSLSGFSLSDDECVHPLLLECDADILPLTRERRVADKVCGGDMSSVITVAKDYEANLPSQGEHLEAHPPADNFVHWCLDHGVELVVRANRGTEPGLRSIGGTYDPQVWKDVGINHLDVPFEDKWGAVPSRETVRSVLTSCRTALSSAAVLLHCKGGFGRSVMLASCLVIYEYDVPGRSVLGWCRIARPGAVTTPQQELFLSALKGRDDVERYANRRSGSKCLCSVGAGLVRRRLL